METIPSSFNITNRRVT